MASIATDPGGRRRILFVGPDNRRRTIRLGRVNRRSAESVRRHVEGLLAAKLGGQPIPRTTAAWLSELPDKLYGRLARAGLVEPREQAADCPLERTLEAYLATRPELKPTTRLVRRQVIRDLARFFGADRSIRSIGPAEAEQFKAWLIRRQLAATTTHKRLQVVRGLFNALRRWKLIPENPFAEVRAPAAGIQARQRFVTREETERLLQACPDINWRLIVVLTRHAGLRCPTEVLSLRWEHVDWQRERITVPSIKTEHLPDRATREIPLFPELREPLLEAFELAGPGAVYVVDERFRRGLAGTGSWGSVNPRTTFLKIIRRAGLEPWPRLFQNLRASLETELLQRFPLHVVTAWLGNTPKVALRHYLMVTEDHFAAAVRGGLETGGAGAAQKAAQQMRATGCNALQPAPSVEMEGKALQQLALQCTSLQKVRIAGAGLEPATSGL